MVLLKNVFEKTMFLLVGIIYLIFHFFIAGVRFPTGINQTGGWGSNIMNLFYFFEPSLWLFFLVGYGILQLIRIKTREVLSIIHVGLIVLSLIISSKNIQFEIILVVGLISLIIFIANVVLSIRNRNSKL
ncbi:hypothetical protein [uncultured Aquimarina sp.]|uniref:hypothetical protein n=1 Tax=uncultured Aquimarina sp. TaxID=575652 RepID=UPI002632C903|nr:hypothetical protein [uncultured Aquimarina sp.]